MQDDKDVVDHSPMAGMELHPVMARYLDGLFVYTGRQSHRPQVIVNQPSATRPDDLFPNARDLRALADELVNYVTQLTDGTVGSLVPKKIIDKLEYNKYEEGYPSKALRFATASRAGSARANRAGAAIWGDEPDIAD